MYAMYVLLAYVILIVLYHYYQTCYCGSTEEYIFLDFLYYHTLGKPLV